MMSSGTNTRVSLGSATIQGCPLSPSLFYTVFDILARAIRQENGIKGTEIEKEVKVPPFGDDMVLYIKNTKYPTKNLVDFINSQYKVPEYKKQRQKTNSLPIY